MCSRLFVRNKKKGDHMLSRNQRKRFYIVNKSLQYRFLAIIIIYGFIIVLFLAAFLFIPDIIRMQDDSLNFHARAAAAEKMLTLHARVWPAVLLIIFLVTLHSFRFFHRLIGPLHRFRKVFEEVANGDVSMKVKIRKKDYLHEEEGALNGMLESLAGKWKDVQRGAANALKSLEELEQMGTDASNWNETAKRLLRLHRQDLETLAETARYFRVKKEEKNKTEEMPND